MNLVARHIVLLSMLMVGVSVTPHHASANAVLIDQGVRAGGVWCFPSASDPNRFYYLPDRARIAKGADGRDIFSILFFADPEVTRNDSRANTVGRGAGGALLTLQLEYDTPESRITAARRFLPEVTDNNKAEIIGPIIFKEGRYQLVTSLADTNTLPFVSGPAPVLEGGRIAISAKLNADEAALLDLSIDSSTPDLAVTFEMQFEGLHQAFDADLTVNWDEVSKSLNAGGSVKAYFVSAEVDVTVESLVKSNAVQLKVRGNDAAMDQLITTAHETVMRFLFEPVYDPEVPPETNSGGSALTGLASKTGGLGQYFSLSAKYKRKDIRKSGTTTISMNKQGSTTRYSPIVFDSNLLASAIERTPSIVRYADLSKTALRKRDVIVTLDASLRGSFKSLISSVTIDLRRASEAEPAASQQLVLTRDDLLSGVEHKFSYPRLYPNQGNDWLDYQYRYNWAFTDGTTYISPWRNSSAGAIVVTPPFQERSVQLIGDLTALAKEGVIAVLVDIEFDRLGERRKEQVQLFTSSKPNMQIDLITEKSPINFDITVTHIRRDDRKSWSFADNSGFAVIDTPPISSEGVLRHED